MKTVGTDDRGGYTYGVRGTSCGIYWGPACADHLVEHVKLYTENRINIDLVGI